MEKIIVSHFLEKPKFQTTWSGMWFGLSSLLIPPFLGIFAALSRYWYDPESMQGREGFNVLGAGMGFGMVLLSLILISLALRHSIRAYKQGERSWVVWLGMVPATLIGLFWIMMIAGEILFPH